jgi:uncharacterized protein YbjQ (UPF0145 family)
MSDIRDLTTGEADAYRRGFADARDTIAAMHDMMAAVASQDGTARRHQVYADRIRELQPSPRPEPTGLEYRGG